MNFIQWLITCCYKKKIELRCKKTATAVFYGFGVSMIEKTKNMCYLSNRGVKYEV